MNRLMFYCSFYSTGKLLYHSWTSSGMAPVWQSCTRSFFLAAVIPSCFLYNWTRASSLDLRPRCTFVTTLQYSPHRFVGIPKRKWRVFFESYAVDFHPVDSCTICIFVSVNNQIILYFFQIEKTRKI